MKTEYLLQREVDQVLSVLTDRNRLIMRVALHTGLRIGDILRLETAQLKPHFWVTETKTGKRRQVGLPEPLLTDLKKSSRGKVGVSGPERQKATQPTGCVERCQEGCKGFPAASECGAAFCKEGLCCAAFGGVRRY